MKRKLFIGFALILVLVGATYGAWSTGNLGPALRAVGLDSLAQYAEITHVSKKILDHQEEQKKKAQADGKAPNTSPNTSPDASEYAAESATEDAIGLALKGINLVQGEKGIELWRLKANWAALNEEGGKINLEKPDVVYRVGDGETPLHVTADKGQVEQNQQALLLRENVVCTYEGYILHAPLMTYDGKTRTMTFPDGAHIESHKTSGFAQILTWHLDTNTIEGHEGVRVSW